VGGHEEAKEYEIAMYLHAVRVDGYFVGRRRRVNGATLAWLARVAAAYLRGRLHGWLSDCGKELD